MTKLKAGILSALALAGVTLFFAVEHRRRVNLREENQGLRQQLVQLAQLTAENERLSNELARVERTPKLPREELSELLRLRSKVGRLHRDSAENEKLRQENQKLRTAASQPLETLAGLEVLAASNPKLNDVPNQSNRRFNFDPETFAQNLGHHVLVTDQESMPHSLLEYFKQNGINMDPPCLFSTSPVEASGCAVQSPTWIKLRRWCFNLTPTRKLPSLSRLELRLAPKLLPQFPLAVRHTRRNFHARDHD